MAVRRAAAPPVHWSLYVFACVGLAFLGAGAFSMARRHRVLRPAALRRGRRMAHLR
jgi:hypothetical protein